jgi:hypothetical protein
MKTEKSVERLLRWRADRAEEEAPPAPRAVQLLERARPWWETWPERFRAQVEGLAKVQPVYGYAMAAGHETRRGHGVPTLIVRAQVEAGTFARVLYLVVRGNQLRLRFQLDAATGMDEADFDVTFLSDSTDQPLFQALAIASADGEYRIEALLAEELAQSWESLRVTDRMPFRFIIHPAIGGG